MNDSSHFIPGRPEGPGPESITTCQAERALYFSCAIVVMDSGLLVSLGPGMTS
jgi:hypothetical protein